MPRNLDLLITESLPTEKREFKPVSPTLLVGIGGTGKEILLRFRRLIVERYGTLEALPFVQFVHLDTDQTRAAQEQYDVKSEDDPLFSKIRFQPAERVDLTIEGGTGTYVEHIDRYPNVKRWFETKGKIANMGDLGKGAGQFRSASRLGFFHGANFQSLSQRLDRVGGLLRDASNQKKASKLGFQLDPKRIEIAVMASIAGGTGGGCFLDMGNLLKKVFPGADRIGIFLLPNFFRGYAGATRARANGYAALTELNYYSFGHSFMGDWDAANPSVLSPPPYTNTYLVDATNEAGLEIGSAGGEFDIYSMVAEFLYQDFSIGSFSGMKRATRVNLEQFNLNVYIHNFLNVELKTSQTSEKNLVGDTYPTRFGSFGLSAISFPTDRVHNACACRLAQRILKSWETTTFEDPLERLFTSFLVDPSISFAQGRYERKDGGGVTEEMQAEDALLWYNKASGQTFTNHIWDRAQSIRGEVDAAAKGQKAAVLDEHLSQADQLLAREDSNNPDEWGQWVRMLEDNQDAYLRQVREGIRSKAEEIANDPRLGVAVAMSQLRELKALLRNENFYYLRYFDDSVGTWQEETTRYSSDVTRLQMDVKRHDRQRLFRKADLRRDLDLLVAESDEDEDLGAIYNYLFARVMKQVAKRGKYVCEQVDKFLGKDDPTGKGLIADYYQLLGGFHQLGTSFKNKEDYYSRETTSELISSLYQRGDVDEWYQNWVGEATREPQVIKRIGNELLTQIFGVTSVTQALEYIQETKTEEVEDQVFAHCKRFFAKQEEQPEALRMLLDGGRFSRAETEEKLRQAYNLAKVWLAKAKRGLEHTQLPAVKDDQRPCLIGLDTSDKARAQELKQIIGNIDDSPRSFLNIGEVNRGMIVFYNELAGVPAFYADSVTAAQGLKESYRNYRDKGELHTDRNRFQFGELIPKTSEEAKKYAHSLRAFVLARLLGLLRVQEKRHHDSEESSFRYSYRKSDPLHVQEVDLGEELNAVDILYRDTRPEAQSDRAQLLEQIEDVVGKLRDRGMLDVYALLIDFYQKNVYPPTTDNEWLESLTIHQFSPEYAVLEDATNNIRQLLPEQQDRDQLKESLRQLKNKTVGDLTYEEYIKALEPYCKRAGKFTVTSVGAVGVQRVNYRDALVLDLSKIDRRFEGYEEVKKRTPRPPAPEPAETTRTRPCPNCHEDIDVRAIFCKHCRKTVAEHRTCEHCGERRVPSDLQKCWKCGRSMPTAGAEQIECPRCYDFTGTESDFPCPVCGYDLAGGSDAPSVDSVHAGGDIPMAEGVRQTADDSPYTEPAATTPPPTELPTDPPVAEPPVAEPPPPEPIVEKPPELVECPSCFERVERDTMCSVCGRPLEAG